MSLTPSICTYFNQKYADRQKETTPPKTDCAIKAETATQAPPPPEAAQAGDLGDCHRLLALENAQAGRATVHLQAAASRPATGPSTLIRSHRVDLLQQLLQARNVSNAAGGWEFGGDRFQLCIDLLFKVTSAFCLSAFGKVFVLALNSLIFFAFALRNSASFCFRLAV